GEPGQPPLLLPLGAVAGDDRRADGRGDHHQQLRHACRAELLAHRGQVADPAATAAVLLGHGHAEIAELARLCPHLAGLPARPGLLEGVLVPVLAGQFECRGSQRLAFGALDETLPSVPPCSSSGTTARVVPTSTCSPGATCSSVTPPSPGAEIWCSIFIASSHNSGWPALTRSPTATATRSTEPGIGASNDPCGAACSGSAKRGRRRRLTEPSGESTHTRPSGYRATEKVRRTPSTISTTRCGSADTASTPRPAAHSGRSVSPCRPHR